MLTSNSASSASMSSRWRSESHPSSIVSCASSGISSGAQPTISARMSFSGSYTRNDPHVNLERRGRPMPFDVETEQSRPRWLEAVRRVEVGNLRVLGGRLEAADQEACADGLRALGEE